MSVVARVPAKVVAGSSRVYVDLGGLHGVILYNRNEGKAVVHAVGLTAREARAFSRGFNTNPPSMPGGRDREWYAKTFEMELSDD